MEAQEVQRLFQMCREEQVSVVAKRHGMSRQELTSLFFQVGLLGNEPSDPPPDEIARETARFRASWDEATERSRWMGARTLEAPGR